jgi:hypothetical protein
MKAKLIVFFLLLSSFIFANMASPYRDGSKNISAFSSKDVTILYENIVIHISQDFQTAKFTIEYNIQSDVIGGQIPLLFYAKDYKYGFTVSLDGQLVSLQDIPQSYFKTENSPFVQFSNTFHEIMDDCAYMPIHWQSNSTNYCKLADLKYFETHLTKGNHTIKVEYIADAWTYKGTWLNEYSYRYSLAPAKYWKSFGTLQITLFQEGKPRPLSTNLGNPIEGQIGAVSTWKFDKLPVDLIEITYIPELKPLAKNLIAIDPFGIMILVGSFLFLIHVAFLIFYSRKNPTKKRNWIIIIGSILVPALMLYSYFVSYDIIDHLIGEDASKRHGYYFLIIVIYPIILLVYLAILWFINWIIKRKLSTQTV